MTSQKTNVKMRTMIIPVAVPALLQVAVPLRVPANSEIVIEGHVRTDAGPIGWDPAGDEPLGPGAVFEGPFGDHTGFYSMPDRYPIVDRGQLLVQLWKQLVQLLAHDSHAGCESLDVRVRLVDVARRTQLLQLCFDAASVEYC